MVYTEEMSSFAETPPVRIEYAPDHDRFGPAVIDPHACATVLKGFGVGDEHIASTTIWVTGDDQIESISDPDHPVVHRYHICSVGGRIAADGSGVVRVNMGSIEYSREHEPERPDSAWLIHGLSDRADQVLMGREGLHSEKVAAIRGLRARKAVKPAIQALVGVGAGVTADVFADRIGMISSPMAWAAGAVIVAASAWAGKMGADSAYMHEVVRWTAYKKWPADLRANQRTVEFMDNPESPVLIRLTPLEQPE